MKKDSGAAALWFSGFFGLGALVHLVRLIFRVQIVANGFEVPLALVFILLSLLLLRAACGGCVAENPSGEKTEHR